MPRNTETAEVSADESNVREFVRRWLARNEFEILAESSSGQPIEKRVGPGRLRLTSVRDSLVALRGGRLGNIVFEIRLTPSESGCLLHGEFYAAGAGGGIPDFLGQEWDLSEKPGWVARLPRKKGFKMMRQFLDELKTLGVH